MDAERADLAAAQSLSLEERRDEERRVGATPGILRALWQSRERALWQSRESGGSGVLDNPGLPADVAAEVLAVCPSNDKIRVLRNPGLPVDLLREHAWALLAQAEQEPAGPRPPPSPNATEEERVAYTAAQGLWNELASILWQERVGGDVLEAAVRTGRPTCVMMAAHNQALPDELAALLLRTGNRQVRVAVMNNVGLHPRVLWEHNWPKEGVAEVLIAGLRIARGSLRTFLLQRMATRGVEGRRVAAAKSSDTVLVSGLCADPNRSVRSAAALNPAASEEGRVWEFLLR